MRRASCLIAVTLASATCAPTLREGVRVTRAGEVEFQIDRPAATSVSVAGEFNGWSAAAHPMARTRGLWTRRIILPPGEYLFMYVVDGREWVTPAPASEQVPDGFGGINGRVVVP